MAVISQQLYPSTDPDGTPIPLDIINFFGLIRQDFTGSAVNSIDIPTDADFLVAYASEACYIRLDDVAAIPSNGTHVTGLIYVPKETFMTIAHNSAEDFGVISDGTNGVLKIYTVKAWEGLRKERQFTHN